MLAEATALALCRRLPRFTLKSLKTINSKTVNEQQGNGAGAHHDHDEREQDLPS